MKQKIILLLLSCILVVSALAQQNNSVADITPEQIVNIQLEAYNARDINAFLATYSDDIEIYDNAGKMTMKGHDDLRRSYSKLFDNTPNLNCRIENRIIINNKVIDKENVIANDRVLEAVAIYDVENGKITKVRFVK